MPWGRRKVAEEIFIERVPFQAEQSKRMDSWFSGPEAEDMMLLLQYMQSYPLKFQDHPTNIILRDLVANAFQAIISKQSTIKEALGDVAKKWEAEAKGS